MKKILTTTFLILMLLVVVGVAVVPEISSAASFLDGAVDGVINNAFAWISYIMLTIASKFVWVTGILLSLSINLTLHIADFFEGIPALKAVWLVIRNITSIFIIFVLLYTSIATILDIGKPNIKELIGKIIMAGLLINFSLVFVKIAIDASNLVSLQFYRAIAPEYSEKANIKDVSSDGGLSDVFMASLQVHMIYNDKDVLKKGNVALSISTATVGGFIMMITASLSFLAASIMFIARTAILLFVMAFSPIFFASRIFPQLKEKSDQLFKLFKNQLIFMPTYLLLMYVALRFISSPEFMAILNPKLPSATNEFSNLNFAGVIIQYVIALVFINAPLIAAIQAGGVGAKWAGDMTNSMNGWLKKRPGAIGGFAGQHVIGRGAKAVQETIASNGLATKNPNLAILANKTLGKVSGGSFGGTKGGYDARVKGYVKERTEYAKKIKTDKNSPEAKAFVETEIAKWDRDLLNQQAQLGVKRSKINEQIAYYNNILKNGDPAAQELAYSKLRGLEEERSGIENKLGQNTNEKRREQLEKLEKDSTNVRAEDFAKNLVNNKGVIRKIGNFGRTKANKEASDAVRKNYKKDKSDKAIDILETLMGKEDKDGGKNDDKK